MTHHQAPTDGPTVECPVCRGAFDPADASSTVDHDGTTYHFCHSSCEHSFKTDPERILAKAREADTRAAGDALSEIPYPAFLVGTMNDAGKPHFMLANWGTQASFEPWRFIVAVTGTARTLKNARKNGTFTINLLNAPHKQTPRDILRAKGADQPTQPGPTNAPRLAAAYAGIDCNVEDVVEIGGDHVLLVGEVVSGWKNNDGPALGLSATGMSYAG